MRILFINVVCGIRSTGRICTDLATALESKGHEVKIAYGRELVPEQFKKYSVKIGSDFDVKMHGVKARLFDACGFGSKKATVKFINWVKDFNPDVIHLHNIHGYYINIEILFNYLRTCGKKIIWTLHDCWAFTGHAAYCESAACERWLSGCYNCKKRREYPSSLIDRSKSNWKKKEKVFSDVPNLLIATPSEWLAKLVKKSFLREYTINVIHNGVDLSVFKPLQRNEYYSKYNLKGKKVILGIAALWEERKGLNDFLQLFDLLNSDYQIVLVGLSKDQIERLPAGIIGIARTNSTEQLVQLYNLADVFINPTYEDNYPTANIEAIACGTPVITYNTGGSPESAQLFGSVVDKGNVKQLFEAIKRMIGSENKDVDLNLIDKETAVNSYLELIES